MTPKDSNTIDGLLKDLLDASPLDEAEVKEEEEALEKLAAEELNDLTGVKDDEGEEVPLKMKSQLG